MSNKFTAQVISSASQFDALEESWRSLCDKAPDLPSALQWEWAREWWRIFGVKCSGRNGGLRIIVIAENKKIVAILPLYLQTKGFNEPRVLRFLSTGEPKGEVTYPEYLTFISAPEHRKEIINAIQKCIYEEIKDEWDEFDLGILAPDSPLVELLLKGARPWLSFTRKLHLPAPRAVIAPGIDQYLSTLPSTARQQFRRLLRQTENSKIHYEIAQNGDEGIKFFEELVTLHQKRWTTAGEMGTFGSSDILRFHKSIISSLLSRQQAFLGRLRDGEETLAVIYGFKSGNKFDFYQSGVNFEDTTVKSPGIVAHLLTIDHLARSGIHIYDFLTGTSNYKQRMANTEITVPQICMVRLTPRSLMSIVNELFERGGNKVRQLSVRYSQSLSRPAQAREAA